MSPRIAERESPRSGMASRPFGPGVALPAATVLAASSVFAALTWLAAADPWPAFGRLDVALSALTREPLSAAFDRSMIAITLFGDFPLTLTLMLALVALLFAMGPRALALHALALFVLTKLVVSIVKVTLARVRPVELYPGGDGYSFPSGHTASAAVLLGVVAALFLARRAPRERVARVAIVAACTLAALLVALSRVRLGAHWPSDVLASLALAVAVLLPFALHARRERAALPAQLPRLALGMLGAGYAAYALLFFAARAPIYLGSG